MEYSEYRAKIIAELEDARRAAYFRYPLERDSIEATAANNAAKAMVEFGHPTEFEFEGYYFCDIHEWSEDYDDFIARMPEVEG